MDDKPKRTPRLRRLRNIAANPRVDVVADHYSDDWSDLWWVRATGLARVVTDEDELRRALGLLADKYPQYREAPDGPVVAIAVERWSSWASR